MVMTTATVAGVWNRLVEEDPIGDTVHADRSTMVLWTQARHSGIYVDLRFPQDSPGRSFETAQNVISCPRPTALDGSIHHKQQLLPYLDVLTRHKSFAGVLEVKAGDTATTKDVLSKDPVLQKLVDNPQGAMIPLCTCFWRRDVDYQPPTGDLDIGICASEASLVQGNLALRETGADASYAEDWSRPASTVDGPCMALQLVDDQQEGFWIRIADRFAYAVGRPSTQNVQQCTGQSLTEALQALASTDEEKLDILASYVGVAGRINDSSGEWVIHHSINPELVGCLLVGQGSLACSRLDRDNDDHVIQTISQSNGHELKRKWKVMELSKGSSLPLTSFVKAQ